MLGRRMLVAMALAAAGCASYGSAEILDGERVARVKVGATKAEVVDAVGKPTKVNFTDGGAEVWEYMYSESKTRAATFVPVVGAFAGGMDTELHTLTILWGEDERVWKVGGGEAYGGGGGMQDTAAGRQAASEREEADEWPTVQ